MAGDWLLDGVDAAYRRLLDGYAVRGGHRYFGYAHDGDDRNFLGPWIWSEADCVLRLALELEREFPGLVHCEMPLAKWTLADFDPAVDARQRVDLMISEMRGLIPDAHAQTRFRAWEHDLFVEAKHLKRQAHGPWARKLDEKVPSIQADLDRLNVHLERQRCRRAAALIVDDGDFLAIHDVDLRFGSVIDLRLSPSRLSQHEAGALPHVRDVMQPKVLESVPGEPTPGTAAIARTTGWHYAGVHPDAVVQSETKLALERLEAMSAPEEFELFLAIADAVDPIALSVLFERLGLDAPEAADRWGTLTWRLAEIRHAVPAASRLLRLTRRDDGRPMYYAPIQVRRALGEALSS